MVAFDEAFSFERQHHLMDRRRADAKILLHVGFGRRAAVQAQILLAADAGASDEAIARSVGVYRTKRRFVLGNLAAALSEEPRPGASRKLSGKEEALLVAACSSRPWVAPAGPWNC